DTTLPVYYLAQCGLPFDTTIEGVYKYLPVGTPNGSGQFVFNLTSSTGCDSTVYFPYFVQPTPPPINLIPGFTSGTNYLICGGSDITVTATAGSTTNPWPYTYTWVRMNNPSPLVLGTGNSMVLSPTTGVTTYRVYADQGTPCVQQFDFTVTVNTFNAVNVLASSNPKYICPGEADTLLLWNDAAGNPSTVNAVSWNVTLIGGLPVAPGEFTLSPVSGSSSTTGTVNASASTE